jgi:hypothetical protein
MKYRALPRKSKFGFLRISMAPLVCRAQRSVSFAAKPRIHSAAPPWTTKHAKRSAAHSG